MASVRDAVSPSVRAKQLSRWLGLGREIGVGVLAAGVAVAVRYWLHLPAQVIPFFLVVIAVCLVTLATGWVGGLTTMIVGGALTYLLIFQSERIDWTGTSGFTIVGYFSVTSVILATSQLYRRSEQIRQSAALAVARQEAEHQSLFAREMSHRLKNAMAIVQSLARQTFNPDIPEVDKFEGRLRALADAHTLLNEHVEQPTASVSEIVTAAMKPFDAHHRFELEGPDMTLPAQQVISLALVLHELGTNAVKYGALSAADGRISIRWQRFEGGIWVDWKERGGPLVQQPATDGFGSRLLRRAVTGAHIGFELDGLHATFAVKN